MKNILTYFLLSLLLNSCSVSGPISQKTEAEQLLGRWKLVESSGGIAGRTETPSGEDIIEISENTISHYLDGELLSNRQYELRMGKSIRSSEEIPLIFYSGGTKQSFEFRNERLVLYDECYDCFQHEYEKL